MILAIFGRGVQQVGPGGPWVPTEDFETQIWNGTVPAHSAIRKRVDQDDPLCLVGGGELNILAGVELCRRLQPHIVVTAYGNRSQYLRDVPDSPSESEVMSERFLAEIRARKIYEPLVIVWSRDRVVEGPSNSRREIRNILELGLERRLFRVGIVTVAVHLPRTILFAREVLQDPQFRDFEIRFFASEQVLVETDPTTWAPRVMGIFMSPAFTRTAGFENRGIYCLLAGTYTTTG